MTDDIDWQPVIGTAAHVPFSGEQTGKTKVAEFFKQVAESEDFEQFEPREFSRRGTSCGDWALPGCEQGDRQAFRL